MKRALFLILSVLLVVCMAACAGAPAASTAPAPAATAAPAPAATAAPGPAATAAAAVTSAPKPQEPVQVTLFMVSGRKESPDSDITKEFLKENVGIDLTAILTNDNWQQKYSLLVSSGDIPTISLLPAANYYEYAAQGAYVDLTDLAGNYPGIMSYVPEKIWPRLRVDGRLYGVANMNVAGKYDIVYRSDWLEKLKMTAPATIDEFTELMRAFTENDPDGNGKNDTYGFGNYNLNMFYGAFGGAPGFYHKNGNTIEIGSVSEGYKQALQYYKMLYDKKYVDPEAITQKSEQFWQKVSQGKVGAYVEWWSGYHAPVQSYDFEKTQPGGDLLTTLPVKGPEGKSGMVAADPLGSVAAISMKVKDPAPILKFMEWAMGDEGYRTMKYGVEGTYFEMDGNKLKWMYLYDAEKKNRKGTVSGDMEVFSMFQRMDIYVEQLAGESRMQTMSVTGFNQAVNNPLIENAFLGLTTPAFQTKMPDMTKYVDEMRIKFILGDEPFDNWGKYTAEYMRLGGQEVADTLLVEYNKMYGESAVLAKY